MAKDFYERQKPTLSAEPLEKIDTPNEKTIEELSQLLDVPAEKLAKTIMFMADGELVAVVTTGDFEVNDVKVQNFLQADTLELAEEGQVKALIGASFGSLGPVKLPENVRLLVDERAADLVNFAAGANEDGKHYLNINWQRDVQLTEENIGDFRTAREGDVAVDGHGHLVFTKGIEIGHIFKLGTRYSKAMGAQVLDENGRQVDMIMGSYGIGVSRLLSAIVEQKADDAGLVWPASVAPFDVHIVPVNTKDEAQARVASQLEELLTKQGLEVLIDDRKERAGVKFADADLIGLPIRITVGKKASEDVVEVKVRASNTNIEMRVSEVVDSVSVLLNGDK